MADAGTSLEHQFIHMIAAEADRRGETIEAVEVINAALAILALSIQAIDPDLRAKMALAVGPALSTRLKNLGLREAGELVVQPEARVQ